MGCTPTASLSGMRPSRERLSISHASSDPTSVACCSTFGGQGYSVTPSPWNSCLLPRSLQLYAKLSEGPQVFKRAECRPHASRVACSPVPCLVLSPAQWLQGSHRQRGLECAESARQAQCPRLRPARAACHSLWLTHHILPEICQISPIHPSGEAPSSPYVGHRSMSGAFLRRMSRACSPNSMFQLRAKIKGRAGADV